MVMFKRFIPVLTLCMVAATAAQAQGGGGGQRPPTGSDSSGQPAAARGRGPAPDAKIQLIGVVKAVDPGSDRVTIAYEANDALNWPDGSNTFVVLKKELLKDVTVGERVRFTLNSQQIATLLPF
jgi:Cu/Ag efflux protein CusF